MRAVQLNSVYRLGNLTFSLANASSELRAIADKLLPACDQRSDKVDLGNVVSLNVDGYVDLRQVINDVLRKHDGTIWIDAGCLLSPTGKRYLIVGKSSAGKSTLTMAMALGLGWKVITEDLLLIDTLSDTLYTFATPFSFKTGTTQLIEETIHVDVSSKLLGEWLPLNSMAAEPNQPAKFDFSIVLLERDGAKPFELNESSANVVLREIFKCSNLMHIPDGPEKMLSYLSHGTSFVGRFGSLRERIEAFEGFESRGK